MDLVEGRGITEIQLWRGEEECCKHLVIREVINTFGRGTARGRIRTPDSK